MKPGTRRLGLQWLGACVLGSAGMPARTRAAEPRQLAVISLVGDELVLVYATVQTGSNTHSNRQRSLPDATGSFDKIVLAAVGKAIERAEPGARPALLGVGPSALHQQPERLFDGGAIALPDGLVDAIDKARATHVLLVTKHRAPTRIALEDTQVGVGSLRGLGYYIDRTTHLRMVESGQTGTGMLVPYAYLQLTLADARSGAVLRQRKLTATRPYAVAADTQATDPWSLLTATEKVERLRRLLDQQLATEIPAFIAPA